MPSPPSGKILLMNQSALNNEPDQRLERDNPILGLCAELFELKAGGREGGRGKFEARVLEHGGSL